MMKSAPVLAAFTLAFSASVHAADPQPPKLRLPTDVAPVRYSAELWVDPAKESFKGKMEIEISLKEETGTVWLNATELDVRTASVHRTGGGEAIPGTTAAGGSDYVGLTFQRNLSPGPWTLVVEYTGRVESKDTEGIFRQKDGNDWYAFSHFEAIYARRAFPCFDEPSFKTPWRLTIHARRARSPCRLRPSWPRGRTGRRALFTFAPTKPLPSSSLRVGPFTSSRRHRGTEQDPDPPIIRAAPPGARWAAESTGPILESSNY